MTQKHWNDFLEKVNFAELTSRWSVIPLQWLDDTPPEHLGIAEEALYRGLLEIATAKGGEVDLERVSQLVKSYRKALSSYTMLLDPELTPAGSKVILRYLDPDDLGAGDCLISLGPWDRVGHFIIEKAGLKDEEAVSGESPARRDGGGLNYKNLLIFPDKGTPSPRAFRTLCEKTFRQARGLGARRLALTHLSLPQTGLPDRFAAAEVVSAIRQLLREVDGITVEIMPFTAGNFADYRHWFLSLAALNKGGDSAQASQQPSLGPGADSTSEANPVFGQAVRDIAERTTSIAGAAGREVVGWFRQARSSLIELAEPSPQAEWDPAAGLKPDDFEISLSFEQQQALNLLYLGHWREAEAYSASWRENSLVGLYLAALYKAVSYLDLHKPKPSAENSAEVQAKEPLEPEKKPKAKTRKKGKTKALEGSKTQLLDSGDTRILEEAEESAPSPAKTADDDKPSTCESEPKVEELRNSLLATAQELGSDNPLSRYFQLLAWRLDRQQPNSDPEALEEDHARLLRAAWAWDDQALLEVLRLVGQEQKPEPEKVADSGYFPVFPMGSRSAPQVD